MLKWVPSQLKQSKLVNAEDTSFCTSFSKECKAWFSLAHKDKHTHNHKHMCKQVKTGST